jgi:hypothetical protein
MPGYDQSNQQVHGNQYNVAGDIYINSRLPEISFDSGLKALHQKRHGDALYIFSRLLNTSVQAGWREYYMSLSIMKGRRPCDLAYADIIKIDDHLNSIPKDSDFFAIGNVLLSIVKSDYYGRQGMPEKGTKSGTLFAQAQHVLPTQADELIKTFNASGNKFYDHLKSRFMNEQHRSEQ